MPAPSDFLDWNPSASNVVAPSGGLKTSGWVPGTRPAAQHTNWQINLIDQWLKWIASTGFADIARAYTSTDSSVPGFSATTDAHAHPGSASNRWKLILRLPVADGTVMRLYAGDGTNGNWCVTTNAQWFPNSGDQDWVRDQNAQEANRLLCTDGILTWQGKAAAGTAWADGAWDSTRGNLVIGDSITAGGDLTVGDDVTIGGDVSVGGAVTSSLHLTGAGVRLDSDGDIHADGSLSADGGVISASFAYTAAHVGVTKEVPICAEGAGDGTVSGVSGVVMAVNSSRNYALRIPIGSTLTRVRAKITTTGATAILTAYKRSGFNYGTTATPSLTSLATSGSVGMTGVSNLDSGVISETIGGGADYVVNVINAAGSANAMTLLGLRVEFTSVGPTDGSC